MRTPMTGGDPAVGFLRSIREYRTERRQLERRLDQLRSEAERITAAYGDRQPGGGGDPHRDALLIEIADKSRGLDTAIRECWRVEELADDLIHELTDYRHRAVLRLRYIECLRWPAVCKGLEALGLYYAEQHVFRLHGRALQEVRLIWPTWVQRHPEIREEENKQ